MVETPITFAVEPTVTLATFYEDMEKFGRAKTRDTLERAVAKLQATKAGGTLGITTEVLMGSPKRLIVEEAERFGSNGVRPIAENEVAEQTRGGVMEHEHSVQAIRARLSAGTRHNYLRDWIYGGIDGTVTTFAVVAGVVGAELSLSIVLILGIANLIADGFSMAASNYLGTRAEHDDRHRMEMIERRHIEVAPEGEREEVREIYRAKGFSGEELERVVELITADRARWIETMLTEEYGLPKESRSAWLAAVSTFSAFILCGAVPLVPFMLGVRDAFTSATVLTGVVFFLIGSAKSRWSTASWWSSGLATLAIGASAAGLAYFVGVLLKGLGE